MTDGRRDRKVGGVSVQANTSRRTGEGLSLTPAETRVLTLLPTHRTLADIGTQLGIGRPTVKTHVEHIYKKLGASKRAEAVDLAENAGLLPHPDFPSKAEHP